MPDRLLNLVVVARLVLVILLLIRRNVVLAAGIARDEGTPRASAKTATTSSPATKLGIQINQVSKSSQGKSNQVKSSQV